VLAQEPQQTALMTIISKATALVCGVNMDSPHGVACPGAKGIDGNVLFCGDEANSDCQPTAIAASRILP
jgi:hypothetical protein